jgi:hypothetical protein
MGTSKRFARDEYEMVATVIGMKNRRKRIHSKPAVRVVPRDPYDVEGFISVSTYCRQALLYDWPGCSGPSPSFAF